MGQRISVGKARGSDLTAEAPIIGHITVPHITFFNIITPGHKKISFHCESIQRQDTRVRKELVFLLVHTTQK